MKVFSPFVERIVINPPAPATLVLAELEGFSDSLTLSGATATSATSSKTLSQPTHSIGQRKHNQETQEIPIPPFSLQFFTDQIKTEIQLNCTRGL